MEGQELQVVQQEQKDTALYLLTKAEIDTQIATAKAFPRSITTFQQNALSMATFSADIAAACTYSLPRGGGKIEGASIRLAEIVASAYKNVQYGGRVIANDGKTITAQGVCIDLENNVKATVEVNRKITDKTGKTFNQDMQVMTGNAAIAIAVRNAIFKVIPSALVTEIHDKAKEVARGTAETLVARRDKAVAYFKGLGVTDTQLCEVLLIKKVGDIDLDRLEMLTGMRSAIKNGETTVKDIFQPEPEIIAIEDVKLLFDMKADAISETDKVSIERIIKNNETKSFKKVMEILKAL